MTLGTVEIAGLSVSRLIIGGNPFSGFSHRSAAKDAEMMSYYTVARIKQTLAEAERQGINTFIGRTDNHILRMLREYRDEGGTIQWIAQTASELEAGRAIRRAVGAGAKACYLHGGVMDSMMANGRLGEAPAMISQIHEAGLPAGVAGHEPAVFRWAEDNLDCDFYMCCHYNPTDRSRQASHVPGSDEKFRDEDRSKMLALIAGLSKPVILYKVLAAGRNDPRQAFDYTARHMRPTDAVCVGFYTADRPDMIAEDVRLLSESLAAASAG